MRKTDWLGEMQTTLAVVLAGMAVAGAVSTAAAFSGGSIEVALPAEAAGAVAGLPPGVAVNTDGVIDVVVARPDGAERAAAALTQVPTYVVVVVLFVLLFLLVRQARRDDPFRAATVRRLRLLGAVAVAGGPLAVIVEMVATMDLTERVTVGATASATLDVTAIGLWLVVGCGFLALGEVVNRGRAMRAELDTVI